MTADPKRITLAILGIGAGLALVGLLLNDEWLMKCAVGIAVALLGSMLILTAYAERKDRKA